MLSSVSLVASGIMVDDAVCFDFEAEGTLAAGALSSQRHLDAGKPPSARDRGGHLVRGMGVVVGTMEQSMGSNLWSGYGFLVLLNCSARQAQRVEPDLISDQKAVTRDLSSVFLGLQCR